MSGGQASSPLLTNGRTAALPRFPDPPVCPLISLQCPCVCRGVGCLLLAIVSTSKAQKQLAGNRRNRSKPHPPPLSNTHNIRDPARPNFQSATMAYPIEFDELALALGYAIGAPAGSVAAPASKCDRMDGWMAAAFLRSSYDA